MKKKMMWAVTAKQNERSNEAPTIVAVIDTKEDAMRHASAHDNSTARVHRVAVYR